MDRRYPKYKIMLVAVGNTKSRTMAGVAFETEWGGLNLRLGPGICLKSDDPVYINLIPLERRADAVEADTPPDDDIPF